MLTFTLIAWPDSETPTVQVLTLPEAGGMIGRGEDCALCLSDSERVLSRHHGEVSLEGGGKYLLRNWSQNGLLLNGAAMNPGQSGQLPLNDGDLLTLGGYRLLVSLPPTSAGVHAEVIPARAFQENTVTDNPTPPPLLTEPVYGQPASADSSILWESDPGDYPQQSRDPDSLAAYQGWSTGAANTQSIEALADEILREFSPERLQHKLAPWRGRGWRKQSWWKLYRNYHRQLQRSGELHIRLRELFLRSGSMGTGSLHSGQLDRLGKGSP